MTHPAPESLLRQIVATCHPRRVIPFGSHARGEAGPDSDLDLMVVLADDAPEELRHYGPVDILTCRTSALEERARYPWTFAATITTEGITVHERWVQATAAVRCR